jgi:hypothetical protein
MKKRSRRRTAGKENASIPLVKKHLPMISRALLEGENRAKFTSFLKDHERNGLYALYKENGELYYVGRASNLVGRLTSHKFDLHGKNWDKLGMYILDEKVGLHDIESLLIGISKPKGNTNKGRLKGDLRKPLRKFMMAAAGDEIKASLYPDQKAKQASQKNRRITENKIETFIRTNGVQKTADILGVSPGRISQLRGQLVEWVIAWGKREKFLLALEKKDRRRNKAG